MLKGGSLFLTKKLKCVTIYECFNSTKLFDQLQILLRSLMVAQECATGFGNCCLKVCAPLNSLQGKGRRIATALALA